MHLFLRNVEYINGLGSFKDPHTVRVRESNGTEVRHITRQWDTGGSLLILENLLFTVVHLFTDKEDNSELIEPRDSIYFLMCRPGSCKKRGGGTMNLLLSEWSVNYR